MTTEQAISPETEEGLETARVLCTMQTRLGIVLQLTPGVGMAKVEPYYVYCPADNMMARPAFGDVVTYRRRPDVPSAQAGGFDCDAVELVRHVPFLPRKHAYHPS